jgi:hypothetical protein
MVVLRELAHENGLRRVREVRLDRVVPPDARDLGDVERPVADRDARSACPGRARSRRSLRPAGTVLDGEDLALVARPHEERSRPGQAHLARLRDARVDADLEAGRELHAPELHVLRAQPDRPQERRHAKEGDRHGQAASAAPEAS